jgi:tight adherence protein B
MEFQLQDIDTTYVIYTTLVMGLLLSVTGVFQLFSHRENRSEAKNRRMKMIARGMSTTEMLEVLKPREKGGLLTRLPFVGNLPRLLLQAGFTISALQFVFLCLALWMVSMIGCLTVTKPLFAFLISLCVGFVLPLTVVHQARNKRSDALLRQLPDALDLMARGLRVGHPLNTSIGAVAEEMTDPIASQFGIVFDQVSFGDDLTDAFKEFSDRVELEDINYLSASIGIQHGTGGDLSSVIQTLSNVIRRRIAMRRKILAISSEGRLSAWFLSALPVFIFGFTAVSTPSYYGGVYEDPMFTPMATAIILLTVLNFLVLRKLVNFRI